MPITLEGTKGGRDLERRARTRGRAEERAELFTAMLVRRFGEDPLVEQAVARLADLPHTDAVDRALSAGTLEELLHDG
jgi:hypothetical protein